MSSASPTPIRPQLAVSASIFRDDRILLVRRARQPGKGVYTLPGGRVEFGETLVEAISREVREETSLAIDVVGFAGWREVVPNPALGVTGHFVILSFATRWVSGEVMLNDELDDARWLAPDAIGPLRTTEGLAEIIRAAQARLAGRTGAL
ncbi:NUDIX hydrolase [Bradyrhizobium sp. 2TAF24]|uniref:NUDIX hydrolase n=1 Tax=Bradyrhizobium sp. 2TAF24 TaxID=3233011 RepID=UPI003F8FEC5A